MEEYISHCRLCLEALSEPQEAVVITELIENWFSDLTQTKLHDKAEPYQSICHSCHRDLKFCAKFRKSLIEKQIKFSKLFGDVSASDLPANEQRIDPLESYVDVKAETSCCYEVLDAQSELNEMIECQHCKELFESSFIDEHTKSHPSVHDEAFKCDECSFKAPSSERLRRHFQQHHATSKESESEKLSVESTKRRKQCPTCGILVKNLSEHQKIVHVRIKRFCCDFCSYSCYFKTKITRHLQRHIPKSLREKFPCDSCDFFATRKDALKSHILTMHQEKREKVFLCVECGKNFYKKSQLNIHTISVHQKIKNHLCNLCGKSFFNAKDMEMHVKRHGVKDHACEVCGNLFYCSLDLKRHIKIHSEPQIACEIEGCAKKFYSNSKLRTHIKVRHEGAKDFFCDYCSSRFSQYNNLNRHVNSVHKSLRINCLVPGCTYSVARKDKYKNHLHSQHKDLSEKSKESIMKNVKFE